MNSAGFAERVRKLLGTELPHGDSVISEGRRIAGEVKIGRSAFMNAYGVSSEAEYKRQSIRDGKIMYHCHIGMSSWADTEKGLRYIHGALASKGFSQDRAGICLDRRMALPASMRRSAPAETGPLLESFEDWVAVGQAAPIQPHMGDFMIGFPASTENTVLALGAGVTTIGNLSQFFSHEAPGWRDTAYTTQETVKAISIMGALREKGTLVHSYLDDGMGALFTDCATVAGWAFLERYIVEDLLGAKLAHCVGGLVSDPIKRSGWIFALQEIHQGDCVGSMIYGDTISFSRDFASNRGVVAETLLWDILTQLSCPTGHAILSIPVTEAVRVPAAEEILEAQIFARKIETAARRVLPYFDLSAPRSFAQEVVPAGLTVFRKAIDGLSDAGVDIKDPVQMLFILKNLGPKLFEEVFGAGKPDARSLRGRDSVVPNDVFQHSLRCVLEYREKFETSEARSVLGGRKILLASTDVHEHALFVIERLLESSGAIVVNEGPERNPDEIAVAVGREKAEVLIVSTHNGMALDYANALLEELEERDLSVPVFMGGVLNQKMEDKDMPIDVEGPLKDLGIRTGSDPSALLKDLMVIVKKETQR
ncbi:MAG TPA: hypothetical protein PLK59_01050 [Synergistales bacterium]|nr:hypothetical protein [Synergistales bacterium]